VNNLPKVVTQLCREYDLNPRPADRKSNALPAAPPCAKLVRLIPGKQTIEGFRATSRYINISGLCSHSVFVL